MRVAVIPSCPSMYDPTAESSQRALAELAKPKVRELLVRIAFLSTRSEADAEDLVAETLEIVLDPEGDPWVAGRFVTHMMYAMRHLWAEKMKTWAARNVAADPAITRDENTVGTEPPVDEQLHERRTFQELRSLGAQLLLEIAAKHPVAKRSFELGAQGIDDPEEQARIIGCEVEDIYHAQDTLKRHAKRIREEHDQAEERRMRELREKHEKKTRKDEGPP
jgi:DNA-directed RNA polymerase specialized sigma24 family protein